MGERMGVPGVGLRIQRGVLLIVAIVGLLSVPVRAGVPLGETPALSIQVVTDYGGGAYRVKFSDGVWDPYLATYTWSLSCPIEIVDGLTGVVVGTILNAELGISVGQCAGIDLSVGVLSGDSQADFTITPDLVAFRTLLPLEGEARASASFSLTDLGGDGAAIMGLGTPGTGAFRGYYNGSPDEGIRFTHLVGMASVNNGGTVNAWQSDPAFGYREIGEAVSSISSEIAFTLTPNDLAYATTTYDVPLPECTCVGDVDLDGVIGISDLSEVVAAYGTMFRDPGYNQLADCDMSGDISLSDLTFLLSVYDQECE